MLVCHVSSRPLRRIVDASIDEILTAVDAATTGNVIFATLVDDPASVNDIVDAFVGDIMLEAASATDTFNAGGVYGAGIDDGANAADTPDALYAVTVAISEVASAADAPDASIPISYAGTIDESVSATDDPDATIIAAPLYAYGLASSRAGLASSIVMPDGIYTPIIPGIGALH